MCYSADAWQRQFAGGKSAARSSIRATSISVLTRDDLGADAFLPPRAAGEHSVIH